MREKIHFGKLLVGLVACVFAVSTISCSSGCRNVTCGPLNPELTVSVRDSQTKGPIADVQIVVNDTEGNCSEINTKTRCSVEGIGVGVYSGIISAPGYADLEIEGEILEGDYSGCCSSPWISESLEVQLEAN